MTDQKPARRVCESDCPHWRKWQDRGDPGLCALGGPDAYTIPGDLCSASDDELRKARPSRRVCSHSCYHWLGPAEYTIGNCELCIAHETRNGDKCRVPARFLRRHNTGWAKDELRARGLKP